MLYSAFFIFRRIYIMEYRYSDKLTSMKPSAIREIFKSLTDPTVISFAAGNPAPSSFPAAEFAEIAARILKDEPIKALQYGITEGYTPLIGDVDERMGSKFGICDGRDQTIITSGGQQGIELTCKVLCNEGDTVICEEPTFIGALNAFRSNGAHVAGVTLNADGIDIDMLEEVIARNPNAKMIYVIPTFHNPAGITSTLENRKKLYETALRHGLIILEDNPYGELRFSGEEVPTIKSMDTEDIVVYCSSFSKILSSGMRLGFIRGPKELIQKIVIAKQVEDVHSNQLFQMICHEYIANYDLDAHIEEIKKLYRHKASLMLGELDRNMPEKIEFTRPDGGLFIWCTIKGITDCSGFVRDAIAEKVAVVPGATFNSVEGTPSPSFRLNYSMPSDENIVKGIGILGKIAAKL